MRTVPPTDSQREEAPQARSRPLRTAGLAVGTLFLANLLLWGATFLPGPLGKTAGYLARTIWTPFILEFTLFACGVVVLCYVNAQARKREGDEFVTIEEPKDSPPPI